MKLAKLAVAVVVLCCPLLCAAATRTDCTKFISPTGGGDGSTAALPETLAQWNSNGAGGAVPGDVGCFESGTYNLATTLAPLTSGTLNSYITWASYDPNAPAKFLWTGACGAGNTTTSCTVNDGSDHQMLHLNGTFPNGDNYIKIVGFNWNGQSYANNCIFIQGSHHVYITNNTTENCISSGIAAQHSDYLYFTGNLVGFNGENPNSITAYGTSCSSNISDNLLQSFDGYSGLHVVIANNKIAGGFCHTSQHTDGSGIIIDNSDVAVTPAQLIANNLAYGNGGRCIMSNYNTADGKVVTNTIVINNTCAFNGLDLTENSAPGNFEAQSNDLGYWINNISVAWGGRSGALSNYSQVASPTNQTYKKDLWNVAVEHNFTPSDETQFLHADPQFVKAPAYNATAGLQYLACGSTNCTIDPANIGNAFFLGPASPARRAGIDPLTLAALSTDANLASDLRAWVYTDINGQVRPTVTPDLGAYQSTPAAASVGSIDATAFTMGLNFNTNPWPTANIAEFRFWDTTTATSNTQWYGLCPSGTQGQSVATDLSSCSNWSTLDTWLTLLKSHSVSRFMFTPGGTPTWASSNPTGACVHLGTGRCYPPANYTDLTNFVNAVHQHVASWSSANSWPFVMDWGCANEPNGGFWYSTATAGYQALGTYCTTVYSAVKSFGSENVGTPAMQGAAGYIDLGSYLTANSNPANYDTVDFHAYTGGSVSSGPTANPEALVALVANYKLTLVAYSNAAGRSLVNEEFSWDSGSDSTLCDQTQEQAWLSRAYPLLLSNGVVKNGWYQWDNKGAGTLQATATTGYGCAYPIAVLPAGVAYKNIQSWYVGNTFTGAALQAGSVWTADLTGPGLIERVVWNTAGTSTYTVPAAYVGGTLHTVSGSTSTIGTTISIGQVPVMMSAPVTAGACPPAS